MSRPDLSALFQAAPPDGAPAPAPVAPPADVPPAASGGELERLVNELRAYQMELEAQNKVLQYSQASAEQASERFEALFASVPLSLMVLDEYDMVVQANAMAHRSFQPTEQDRPLTALMPFVSPEDGARVRRAFEQARTQGQDIATEVAFRIAEHGCITGDLHIACITLGQDSEAPQRQYLCAVIDQGPLLAERRALQERNEQLHASEKRLEAVINSALDAIICVDQHQRITVFNPTAAVLFQCSASDALGSRLDRFLPGAADALGFVQLTTQAMLGEMTARTASGKDLAVEVSVTFERHADGETTTVFARDLTSRKRAEAQRAELEAQLRESHKMQAMGTMAGGIAHDFNNILGAILGNVGLAMADCAPGSAALESLREIEKAGRRARDLVRQILTFSRNEPPRLSAVHLPEALHDTERLLRVTLPPSIDLHIHCAPHLPVVLADPTQVEQALVNLCTNAIHAIGEARGTVQVEAAAVRPEPHLCERLGLPAGEYVAISVRDNGPGMDAATLQRVFEPFFTTKRVGQGTGLGLAVVHGVMRTHAGAVDVQSSPGHGSCFTLYFPAGGVQPAAPAPTEPTPAPAVPAAPAPRTAQQQHVIYVDDDQALVFLVERLLRRRGYRVSGYTDPQEALQALRAAPQACHLLVTDYNMPGFSGVEVLQAVRQIRPDLPVALASGYVSSEIEQAALAAGARALIHKPNDVQELCDTVDRLIHGGP
ncbi:PAS domain-containing hybrid sensor histidine kinase/response regulator [Comamonas granuli]|uniref:PAS domain-containing hybrid sensor histidine kinase/response regulator n=1 Tax=Comamonas granuli TaxID=290309 RepID=UPI0005AAE020|nr:PAS domain-containing sensor histidine kinase [Comamonas granuli]